MEAGLLSSSNGILSVRVVIRVIPRWPFPEQAWVPPAGLSLNRLMQCRCCPGLSFLCRWLSRLTILFLDSRGYRPILFGIQVKLPRNLMVLVYGL